MQKLPATYFGPAWWYSELLQRLKVADGTETLDTILRNVIDSEENFQKQTLRNRCIINTAQGLQKLTIPVVGSSSHHQLMAETLISDHGNWRHQHWQAILTAYGNTPFFEYYRDYIQPFYVDDPIIADSLEGPITPPCRLSHLLDFNIATTATILRLLIPEEEKNFSLFTLHSSLFTSNPSPPDLSILDLLFNKGPEAIECIMHNS